MPREVVALVSADDLVAAVRVHADRVHDLLRRSGCGPEESIEVCESYAFALIDAVVNAPETVGDMAGWWFGRALELGRRLGGGTAEAAEATGQAPTSVLSGTTGEGQVRAALAGLPEQERAAVMLRDAYDLPPQAVAVALARDIDSAAALVAAGRLRLVAAYDDRSIPELTGHTGRTPADIGTLGRYADGTLPPQRTVPLRRHLGSCRACEDIVEMLAKGRRLVAGLPVVAMPDDAREAMIERITSRAHAVLPSVDDVLLAIEEDDETRPAVSPLIVILAIVLALVLGVAVAAVTTLGPSGEHALVDAPTSVPSEQPSFSVSATPRRHSQSPSPRATSGTPTPSATPTSVSPTPTRTHTPKPAFADIQLTPTSGPRGTNITVTGTGWQPGALVTLRYSGTLVSSTSSATVDKHGQFVGHITARGTLPGTYTVTADDGSQTAPATFEQTS
ncbi:MAG: hypothetical protein QOJ03_3201 [Frankiaceae bacterium]|nr:hypothetical protein [Frankiaceae bacterium]